MDDDRGAADASRDAALVGVARAGVDAEPRLGVVVLRFAVFVPSEETTTSSSSTTFASGLGVASFFAPGTAQRPSGSIVTCSVDSEVCSRISRAYLQPFISASSNARTPFRTHSSTASWSNGTGLLQMGHSH